MSSVAILTEKLITGDMLAEMGEIGPCELVAGRIIEMSPTNNYHSELEFELAHIFSSVIKPQKRGKIWVGEAGIYTRRSPDTVRGADIIVISNERLAQRQSKKFLDVAPELIVEIISPNDRWQDIQEKLAEYFAIGTDRVWLVDPKHRTILVYASLTEAKKYGPGEIWTGEGLLADLKLDISGYFSCLDE